MFVIDLTDVRMYSENNRMTDRMEDRRTAMRMQVHILRTIEYWPLFAI